jgi:hypothetical protein
VAQNTVFDPSSIPTPAAPVAAFPVSQKTNFRGSNASNLWVFEPALKTPYVIEWSLSLSRELWNRVTVEARYVGNHAVKQFRATDINEINLLNNPYSRFGFNVANSLTEFQNAANNLAICSANRVACTGSTTGTLRFNNVGLPGQVDLPIFQALFSGDPAVSGTGAVSASSGFQNTNYVTWLTEGQIGRLFDDVRRSNISQLRTNREALFPLNFFVPNPFANSAILVNNDSWSYYHGLEFEVRRRFSSGLFFQANYTFGKVLTDTRFLTSQNEFSTYQSLENRGRDKNRAAFDVTHSIAANFIYPLPFGRGRKFGSGVNAWLDGVIGGWSFQGFTRIASGAPLGSITGARVTTGSFITDLPINIRNMTASELMGHTGVFKTPEGVFWLDPQTGLFTINTTTKATTATICTPGQTTPCFEYVPSGDFGNLPYFGINGPRFVNQDFSIIKRIPIPAVSEGFNLDLRFEFFNAFNHPNFGTLTTNVTSSSFGKLTDTVDTVRGGGVNTRIIQWAFRVNW